MKKIHASQLTLKIFMLRPKKNSYKEFDNKKKNSCGSKIPHPPPPITFLMVRRVFQRRTSTGSEDLAKPLLRNVKSPLPVGVRPLETPLLKFSIINDKRQTTISYT